MVIASVRYLSAGACALAVGAVVLAPAASAVPTCTNLHSTTTKCETSGSTQITTTPPPRIFDQWSGVPLYAGGFGPVRNSG